MKIKTKDLIGPALDWVVATALGALWQPKSIRNSFFIWPPTAPTEPVRYSKAAPPYSTDWAQGGPIIERERIDLAACTDETYWLATKYMHNEFAQQYGPTPLIAAMRCFVASKLGDKVDVPKELT